MKLLEAEPQLAPPAPSQPSQPSPAGGQPTPVPAAGPGRTCGACGTAMLADQDWCLSCGTAAAGRLEVRPSWRAAGAVVALTLALVVGAVVASYAALNDTPAKPPGQPAAQAPPGAQAQVPQSTPQTPAPTAPPPDQQQQPPPPSSSELPKVSAPRTPTTSTPSPTPVQPTPTTTTPSTGETDAGTPAKPKLAPIELEDDAGSVYDPYGRATATGDPLRALDADRATSWYVDPKDAQLIGVGYAIDLGKLRGVKVIELETATPGFRIEVYATDEATPPPDILDTRWSHIKDVSDVGVRNPDERGDVEGEERIVLGRGTSKYRTLLLWFTEPPIDRPRLRITELDLFS